MLVKQNCRADSNSSPLERPTYDAGEDKSCHQYQEYYQYGHDRPLLVIDRYSNTSVVFQPDSRYAPDSYLDVTIRPCRERVCTSGQYTAIGSRLILLTSGSTTPPTCCVANAPVRKPGACLFVRPYPDCAAAGSWTVCPCQLVKYKDCWI